MPADTMIAPAPGAPAPAPAPTPSPSPRPSPAPSQDRPSSSDTGKSEISAEMDAGAEMDSIFDRAEKRYAPKTPDKPSEEKDQKDEPATALDKPKTQPTTPKAVDKPSPSKREGEKQLEAALAKANKERDDSVAKIKEYETKIKDYDLKGKNTEVLTAQLEAERKEKDGLMGKIRRLTKEHDPAFKEKWEKPLNDEFDYTSELIKTLHVGSMVEDAETGQMKWQPSRPANVNDDFIDLYHLFRKNPVAAREQAEQRFGRGSVDVIGQITELHRLSRKHEAAKAEEEAKWKENETREIADHAVWQENFTKARADARKTLIDENLEDYAEDPDDPEGNALLKDGFEFLDYQPKTFNERVRALERNTLNAAAFLRMRHRYQKVKAELDELKGVKEERKNSEPGKTKRTTDIQPSSDDNVTSESLLNDMRTAINA